MTEIKLRTQYIKLGQLLKAAGLADTGSGAKDEVLSGGVTVNGDTELRRGRKIYPGDIVRFGNEEIRAV